MIGTEALNAVKFKCKLDEDMEPAVTGEPLKVWYEQAQEKGGVVLWCKGTKTKECVWCVS